MAFAFDIILSCRAVSLLIILISDTLESKVASSLILECWDFGDTCWAVQHTLYNLYIWQQGHGELVSILLEHGAEVDIINFQGRTFLHLACSRGHEKIVDILLKWGAKSITDHGGQSPLHDAGYGGNKAIVEKSLHLCLDPNARLGTGATTLHWTAANGKEGALRLLVEAGADLTAQDSDGRTALDYAIFGGYEATIQLLLEAGCHSKTPPNNGETVLDHP